MEYEKMRMKKVVGESWEKDGRTYTIIGGEITGYFADLDADLNESEEEEWELVVKIEEKDKPDTFVFTRLRAPSGRAEWELIGD